MKTTTDMLLRVWNDDEGVCLEVGPDADGFGPELRTGSDDTSIQWFGKQTINFGSKDYAVAVANAILKVAESWPED